MKMKIIWLNLFLFFCNASIGASFNCEIDELNDSEKTICDRYDLSALDELMSKLYIEVKSDSAEKSKQRQWIKDRNVCKGEYGCIERLYRSRILQLAAVLDLVNPELVKDPVLFTTFSYISDSGFRRLAACTSFEDINFDSRPEVVCWPDCGGPACSWYFFVSNKDNFIYFPELEKGSYDQMEVLQESEVPTFISKKYQIGNSNILNGWYMLVDHYSYQGVVSSTYYCNVGGRYQKC